MWPDYLGFRAEIEYREMESKQKQYKRTLKKRIRAFEKRYPRYKELNGAYEILNNWKHFVNDNRVLTKKSFSRRLNNIISDCDILDQIADA